MQIDVYHGSGLAASFEYRDGPHMATFYGAAGQEVRALVARPHPVDNPWTGEHRHGTLPAGADWWAADILAAGLTEAGYRIVARGLPAGAADEALPDTIAPASGPPA